MKKAATALEDRAQAAEPWREALALFNADLRRRGMAEKTRRTYGVDLGRFALWCAARGLEPRAVGGEDLRRYAATLAGPDAGDGARRLGAVRAFYRALREHGLVTQNPVDLIPAPERPRTLRDALRPDALAGLLDRVPASTPLELRDRTLLALACACGLSADELVALDVACVDAAGGRLRARTRTVAVVAPALSVLTAYLERARPALAAGDGDPALFLSKSGRRLSTSDVRRRLRASIAPQLVDASVSSAQIYTRVESARLKSAYARSHPRA
jgi:integrase/recombinase XerC/integrase/recombinase XerD